MILFRTLQRLFRTHKIEMKWSKDGIACTLNRMKIIGDMETATVNVVRLYRIFKVIIEVDELYLISEAKTEKNKHDNKKVRRVDYMKNVSVMNLSETIRLRLYSRFNVECLRSDRAVELILRKINENLPDRMKRLGSLRGVWLPRPIKKYGGDRHGNNLRKGNILRRTKKDNI